MKYKVGQKVKITKTGSHGFPKGTIVTLTRINQSGDAEDCGYKANIGSGLSMYISGHFEALILKDFKIGDTVKVVYEECGHNFSIGSIVTVTHVDVDSTSIRCEDGEGEGWWLIPREVELIDEPNHI